MRVHSATQIVEAINVQLHAAMLELESEMLAPGSSADVSDHKINALRNRVAELRRIRNEVEDLLSISLHPGF